MAFAPGCFLGLLSAGFYLVATLHNIRKCALRVSLPNLP